MGPVEVAVGEVTAAQRVQEVQTGRLVHRERPDALEHQQRSKFAWYQGTTGHRNTYQVRVQVTRKPCS